MRHLALVAVLAGCGDPGSDHATPPDASPDAPIAPVFRNAVATPDDQLAKEALGILATCENCHGMTKQRVRYWRALSDTAMGNCLTDLAVSDEASARKMIDCTRAMPDVPTADFETKKLGIYATATHLPWFQFTFWRAYGDEGAARLADLTSAVGMPKGGPHLTQEQFDVIAEWFARGVPLLDEELGPDPAPSTCTPGISADVSTHVTAMATTGWRAVNRTNLMAMYGCGSAADPRDCLASEPLASTQSYGATWDIADRGTARVLHEVTYKSAFWTRSSPDGRFVGHGVANVEGSNIVDLQRDATVSVDSQYDPAFFPDNSGFVFQGGPRNVCGISVLTSNPTSVSMTEAACSRIVTIGLYEHVGRGLNGGDFFAIDGQFESDDGGKEPTFGQPAASFTINGFTDFTPMIFDGTRFVTKQRVRVLTPFEGDTVLSPSARLELTRVAGPNEKQLGYVLRKVVATPSGSTYTITAPEIARYCFAGGKPGFSYDERWIAFHRYITNTDADAQELGFTGKSDPGFAAYAAQGAANLYLMDLRTGTPVRFTNMAPGQYALFPHFRSDGWIYAQVRDLNTEHEYTIAHDAALLAE
jgi:hypothetical protein